MGHLSDLMKIMSEHKHAKRTKMTQFAEKNSYKYDLLYKNKNSFYRETLVKYGAKRQYDIHHFYHKGSKI